MIKTLANVGILIQTLGVAFGSTTAPFKMNQDSHCTAANGISTVQVPLFPGQKDSPTFPFSYKIFNSNDADAPTIIELPGGPGQTLLGHTPNESFPNGAITTTHFNVVYLDHRGLGCNQLAAGEFPIDAFKTEYLANDVTTLIRELQAKGMRKYFLYGDSFGTVVATQAAYRASQLGMLTPSAVVLEGTLGRGVPGKFDEYVDGFTAEWERVKAVLPAQMSGLFGSNPLPLGFTRHAWAQYLFWQMISGAQPTQLVSGGPYTSLPIVEASLYPLLTNDATGIANLKAALQEYAAVVALPVSTRYPRIFQTLGCQELFGSWKSDVTLQGARLVGDGDDICGGFAYHPYDSAKVPISSPIFYFQGPFDPATPLASAQYHMANQKKSVRSFNTVFGASHAPMSLSLRALGCSEDIWRQISARPTHPYLDFSKCHGWKIDQKVLQAGH